MNPIGRSNSSGLSATTTGFVLAAAVSATFNTALAWAKDMSAPLNAFMKSMSGHHWTTHGVADLAVFLTLGFIFTKVGLGAKLSANQVIGILVGAVGISSFGLALWFLLV